MASWKRHNPPKPYPIDESYWGALLALVDARIERGDLEFDMEI